jgi:crotonobetainyl-CoA:carnitine CoA-transferase CaiB-like acyl-CoA transferase
VAARLRTRPAADWISDLDRKGVPCGVVRGVAEALQEEGAASARTGVSPSVPGTVRYPPPRLDEHGDDIRRVGWGVFASGAMTEVTK